jgi:hypothetical protein
MSNLPPPPPLPAFSSLSTSGQNAQIVGVAAGAAIVAAVKADPDLMSIAMPNIDVAAATYNAAINGDADAAAQMLDMATAAGIPVTNALLLEDVFENTESLGSAPLMSIIASIGGKYHKERMTVAKRVTSSGHVSNRDMYDLLEIEDRKHKEKKAKKKNKAPAKRVYHYRR